eukprot:scaffold20908_cov60-Phaeocystis_antarctica.AAC.4
MRSCRPPGKTLSAFVCGPRLPLVRCAVSAGSSAGPTSRVGRAWGVLDGEEREGVPSLQPPLRLPPSKRLSHWANPMARNLRRGKTPNHLYDSGRGWCPCPLASHRAPGGTAAPPELLQSCYSRVRSLA